jgi:hypothetical protein
MADPADGFYIQDEPDKVPNGIACTEEDYGDMIIPDTLDADDINNDVIDKYLNAELIFDVGTGSECRGRVVKRAKGTSGEPIGRAHSSNPLFDTREYVIGFTDGTTENYFAHVIAECMYAQIDSEGNQYQLMSEMNDHRSDNSAIQIADGFTTSLNGNCVPKPTTQGWSLLVSWRDGSSDWLPLKDLNHAYPVLIAEYAAANKIADEPAFNWWVHTVLRKGNRIVTKVKRYWRTTHKFGIRAPKTVKEALAINDETGTGFWRKVLGKEMTKVKVAWKNADGVTPEQAQTGKEPSLIGFQEIRCHVIFDVKMDFTRKARFVAGGHMTDTPGSITHSSVVSRDTSVRLAFLIAGLNDLDVLAGDVTNAYLNASCREKICFEGGVETGEDRGKVLIVTRALNGLKSSGAAWRADLAATLRDMNFTLLQANPDVRIRIAATHYDMVLVYVDDILVFAKEPKVTMDELGNLYELKAESVHEPDIYLGAKMKKVQLLNDKVE